MLSIIASIGMCLVRIGHAHAYIYKQSFIHIHSIKFTLVKDFVPLSRHGMLLHFTQQSASIPDNWLATTLTSPLCDVAMTTSCIHSYSIVSINDRHHMLELALFLVGLSSRLVRAWAWASAWQQMLMAVMSQAGLCHCLQRHSHCPATRKCHVLNYVTC